MKRTPFYEIEKTMGAEFESRSVLGSDLMWEIASRISSLEEECAAVHNTVGLMDLSHRGKIVMTGPDRVRFLNGQVTNDVKRLSPGQGAYACILNHKGALLGDLKVYALPESLLLDTAELCTEKLLHHLMRFAISDDVEITDQTENSLHLGVHGPRSIELLKKFVQEDVALLSEYDHREVCNGTIRVVRQNYTGEIGFDLFAERKNADGLWKKIGEAGEPLGLRVVGAQAANILRIEAGVASYGIDMTEDHLPLEANLMSAISTDKGCYVGQEVVARIIYRGHVNRILSGLRVNDTTVPSRGEELFKDEKSVGEITSAVFSPTLRQVIALGYVLPLHSQPGTQFHLGGTNAPLMAEVVALPFYKAQ